ncbi:hypothetical protein PTSG_11585 [Salpingoeca rosetta]|uniref:Glutathione peroxidase n=1 Tax=Salpingoeca rosetta (strain ATCC 50818 / BSB-021) TaxID=946362 RepID=F2TWE4_SALR5|nr:uncharacterized protein PTSG_11585 [Salpingoeca rosetta]EGD72390.1 hypothetical protein PTSG_11585 [Salpingoeca rosetta]|eukprot:XP_004998959.1 hypothetical protein PTSG_11585 [Salpingoeca rosetta]
MPFVASVMGEQQRPVQRACGLAALLVGAAACACAVMASSTSAMAVSPVSSNGTTIFDFQDLVDIQGKPMNLSHFRGNVSLVINVASF